MSWASKAVKKLGNSVKKVASGSGLMGAITGGLAGGLLGGPAGALAGAGLGFMSGAGQDAANEANAEAVEAANNANIALWREQAAYNTPANQVARLRAAGLNPNLFYSQGDTGNMSSAPTMKAAQYDYNYAQAVDKVALYYQAKNLAAQNANLQAQTDNIRAQTRLKSAEAEYQQLVLDYYRDYGVFPNQGLVPSFIKLVKDLGSPIAAYSGEALGQFVGENLLTEGDRGGKTLLVKSPYDMTKAQREYMVENGYVYDANERRWMKW